MKICKPSLKITAFIVAYLINFIDTGYSQTIPASFSTQFIQFSMGNRSGHSETNDPTKTCTTFIMSNNKFIGKDCLSNDAWINITLVTVDQTKYSTDGGWSKRYFGFDTKLPSYQPDGTQSLTHVVTIGYDNQKNSYNVLLEVPETYKDVSFVWHFFNL